MVLLALLNYDIRFLLQPSVSKISATLPDHAQPPTLCQQTALGTGPSQPVPLPVTKRNLDASLVHHRRAGAAKNAQPRIAHRRAAKQNPETRGGIPVAKITQNHGVSMLQRDDHLHPPQVEFRGAPVLQLQGEVVPRDVHAGHHGATSDEVVAQRDVDVVGVAQRGWGRVPGGRGHSGHGHFCGWCTEPL